MNIVDLINKKRLNNELTDDEIRYITSEYMNDNIKDYQMSALLMAICINDMTDNEVMSLTKYMILSGDTLDLSFLGNVVDKHSTGGIGDKTTLIVGPIVSSSGVNVCKMSGRGLGYTGGTIDKLESIPGFRSNLSISEIISQVKNVGFCDVCQSNNLVPLDKKLYALRDVTGTVNSIPLIASSIMSKKIAGGSKKIVIDVKVGRGALVEKLEDARRLANLMIKIGKNFGVKVICVLTNMDIPLGNNVGNMVEVLEVIDVLKNNKRGYLYDLCIELSSYMISIGLNISYDEAKEFAIESVDSGSAYNKFLEFVNAQGGNLDNVGYSLNKYEIKANKSGYLNDINALKVGELSMMLGAGRITLNDNIDYSSGVVINKNLGDYVDANDVIMTLYTKKDLPVIDNDIFSVEDNKNINYKLIYEVIN